MLLNLHDGRFVNTEYFITVGVGTIKDQEGHHVIATLINGQLVSLYMHDSKTAAQSKLELIAKDHNLHHMIVDNLKDLK